MWDPLRPGLEPVSSVLAGGFLTTAPAGKPGLFTFRRQQISWDSRDDKYPAMGISGGKTFQVEGTVSANVLR